MLKLKYIGLRAFTIIGEQHSFISSAVKLRCNARIDNPLSARALSCITTFPRSFNSSPSEDDDYSELGSPVPKAPSNPRKLMTEKPEPYMKTNRKKKSSGKPSKSSISSKDVSSERDDQEEVTIRITNINSETSDSAVHSMCKSCGSLAGVVRTKADAVDALFSVKDNMGIQSLIRKLNQMVVNDHKWSANLHSRDSTPAVTSKQINANCDLGLDISHHLGDLRSQISVKTVCIEDLEYLHNALLHLEAQPDRSSSIPNSDS
ncbi:uncharacterized protein LOC117636662 isoform X4 [Prunus dulcis]|uniref:uncharacterized protein LOC117636662 isoform X4 n=1 Tax=Prunus dulcis TaxID=3755 RepID=UPI0014833A20|nr:uncharacterized protein LOC117636662 isoform X4 [Prunus dulcis]